MKGDLSESLHEKYMNYIKINLLIYTYTHLYFRPLLKLNLLHYRQKAIAFDYQSNKCVPTKSFTFVYMQAH